MSQTVLEGVTKRFGAVTAVDRVSVRAEQGRFPPGRSLVRLAYFTPHRAAVAMIERRVHYR